MVMERMRTDEGREVRFFPAEPDRLSERGRLDDALAYVAGFRPGYVVGIEPFGNRIPAVRFLSPVGAVFVAWEGYDAADGDEWGEDEGRVARVVDPVRGTLGQPDTLPTLRHAVAWAWGWDLAVVTDDDDGQVGYGA